MMSKRQPCNTTEERIPRGEGSSEEDKNGRFEDQNEGPCGWSMMNEREQDKVGDAREG